jgi:hypothetical protein
MTHRIQGTVIIPVEVPVDVLVTATTFETAVEMAKEIAIRALNRKIDLSIQQYNAEWEVYPEEGESEV